ncbi:MAG: hypothetical protein E7314_02025 [Clostridiales bacterium]|nr:hypothetical protein [Clostridiales bacterium]
MNNKMVKYNEKFFTRILNRIKLFFNKNKMEQITNKEIVTENIIESNADNKNDNYEQKQRFVQLITKFEANEITKDELSLKEIEQLIKYYENKNDELDKKISSQKNILQNLNIKLNRTYERAIKLKQNK